MQFLKQNTALALVGALFIFCLCVWTLVYAHSASWRTGGALTFAVMDVGQGDSLYIEGPTGIEVVVDGGPDDSLLTQLPKLMPPFDRSLDAIIETHPDADHIAGFVDLLKRYQVGAFIEPGIPKKTLTADAVESEVLGEKIPRYIARRGMWLDLGGGARLEILFPDFDTSRLPPTKDNEGVIVAHLVYGNTSALLMADAPVDVEQHLMQVASTTELESDILKVGHHGSKYSTGDAFVAEVQPSVAVISVGAHNKYGFPTQLVLGTLARHNIQVVRTDESGTIIFRSDGEHFTRE